jgi:hypothetical protein
MKGDHAMRSTLIVLVLAASVAGATLLAAGGQPTRQTITGEVIDIAAFAMKEAHGEQSAEAARFRAEQGFPLGILDPASGDVYLAVYRNPAPASKLEPGNGVLLSLVGKEVVAQGRVFTNRGAKVIEIAVVSEM